MKGFRPDPFGETRADGYDSERGNPPQAKTDSTVECLPGMAQSSNWRSAPDAAAP